MYRPSALTCFWLVCMTCSSVTYFTTNNFPWPSKHNITSIWIIYFCHHTTKHPLALAINWIVHLSKELEKRTTERHSFNHWKQIRFCCWIIIFKRFGLHPFQLWVVMMAVSSLLWFRLNLPIHLQIVWITILISIAKWKCTLPNNCLIINKYTDAPREQRRIHLYIFRWVKFICWRYAMTL